MVSLILLFTIYRKRKYSIVNHYHLLYLVLLFSILFNFIGEGIGLLDNTLLTLSWREKKGFVFHLEGNKLRFDKTISYNNEEYSLSGFCVAFMPDNMRNTAEAYQGPKYFSYNGKSLVDLRNELKV